MPVTAGLDVGTGSVKVAVFQIEGDATTCLGKRVERIRQRDPFKLAEETFDAVLSDLGLQRGDLAYIASTGEAETLAFTTGHFYSMTTHARGGIFLEPAARSILDIGALHGRAVNIDPRDPAQPIATPAEYAFELAEAAGPFYTQEMPEEIDEWSQAQRDKHCQHERDHDRP